MVKQKEKIEEIHYTRTKKSKPRKVAQDTFLAHLPREIVQVDIPEGFEKRIKSREMIVIRESIRESLKFVPPKLVVVEYREAVQPEHQQIPPRCLYAYTELNLKRTNPGFENQVEPSGRVASIQFLGHQLSKRFDTNLKGIFDTCVSTLVLDPTT